MADLQSILAETSKSYDNSRQALNNQINAISGDLAAQQDRINAQYAQQSKSLDNQRNYQAQASSMASSRNGGSFGGANEIANKKYYQQTYVPAVTQMQTNQANDLSSAESTANANKQSLQSQLAALEDQVTQTAYSRYDQAKQLEEQQRQFNENLAWQKQQAAQQLAAQKQAYSYMYSGGNSTQSNKYTYSKSDSEADGILFKNAGSNASVRFGTYYGGNGGSWNNSAVLNTLGDIYGTNSTVYNSLKNIVNSNKGLKLSQNTGGKGASSNKLSSSDKSFLNWLGLKMN